MVSEKSVLLWVCLWVGFSILFFLGVFFFQFRAVLKQQSMGSWVSAELILLPGFFLLGVPESVSFAIWFIICPDLVRSMITEQLLYFICLESCSFLNAQLR